eukprot:UN17140
MIRPPSLILSPESIHSFDRQNQRQTSINFYFIFFLCRKKKKNFYMLIFLWMDWSFICRATTTPFICSIQKEKSKTFS